MKYALIVLLSLLHFSLAAQTSKVAVRYSSDSAIVGTGLVEKNLPNGLWKFYATKTNTLVTEGFFKNGLRDGQWASYHANGKRKELADYREGKLFGPARFFDSNGFLVKEMIFQDSIPWRGTCDTGILRRWITGRSLFRIWHRRKRTGGSYCQKRAIRWSF